MDYKACLKAWGAGSTATKTVTSFLAFAETWDEGKKEEAPAAPAPRALPVPRTRKHPRIEPPKPVEVIEVEKPTETE